jgi:hypothetical protein
MRPHVDGRWRYQVRDGCFHESGGEAALVFAVALSKILAFGKGAFSHTRHRFQERASNRHDDRPSVIRVLLTVLR